LTLDIFLIISNALQLQ